MKLQKVLNLFNVAIYIRLSREDGDKEESDSVGNQRKLLTEYVAKKEDFILYDIYVDDGYSGTNFNRPSLRGTIPTNSPMTFFFPDVSSTSFSPS